MARVIGKIPFVPDQASGSHQLGGSSPVAMNVVLEKNGTVRRRPAVVASALYADEIDPLGLAGIHSTVDGKVYAVGESRNIYRVTAGFTQLSGTLLERLAGNLPPVFAETEAIVAIAGGGVPQKIEVASDAVSRLGGNPNQCSHIIANALRLSTNEMVVDKSKVRYSEIDSGSSFAGHETWTVGIGTAGFYSAEARPDPVVALYENTNEVWLLGATNFELYTSDPNTVYARTVVRENGCSAPYSVINYDQAMAFLDNRRRFVMSDGRETRELSESIGQVLDDMETVSDCRGFRVKEGPLDALVWTFPTDGRTFVYQMGGGWSQWAGYSASNQWDAFPATCHTYNNVTGENLVGTSDGKVGRLAMGQADDLQGRIVAYVETGYQNRGTDRLKHCVSVRLSLEMGVAPSGTLGKIQYSDAPGVWSEPLYVVSSANDTRPVVEFRSLGVYRRRAWRFEFSAEVDLALVEATEEYEELEV